MPVTTRIAVLILWVVFLLDLGSVVFTLISLPSVPKPGLGPGEDISFMATLMEYAFLVANSIFWGALELFLLLKLSAGKNWVRISVVVIVLLIVGVGLYNFIANPLLKDQRRPENLVFPVLQLVAVILLLMPASSAWFKKNRPATKEMSEPGEN